MSSVWESFIQSKGRSPKNAMELRRYSLQTKNVPTLTMKEARKQYDKHNTDPQKQPTKSKSEKKKKTTSSKSKSKNSKSKQSDEMNERKVDSGKKKKKEDANEILCLYPSDTLTNKSAADSTALYLRKSPFYSAPTHNKDAMSMKNLLKYDKKNKIYYLPVGMYDSGLQFKTSSFAWPKQYTILMWIRWKRGGTITTFDSNSYSPIYASGPYLGCASGNSWEIMDNYQLEYDKWQCVIVFGGDNRSKFYIGDLLNEPKSVGYVACDIAGQTTYRIGNARQGPGDIACIVVFDTHKSLKSLTELYHQSIFIMGNHQIKSKSKSNKKQASISPKPKTSKPKQDSKKKTPKSKSKSQSRNSQTKSRKSKKKTTQNKKTKTKRKTTGKKKKIKINETNEFINNENVEKIDDHKSKESNVSDELSLEQYFYLNKKYDDYKAEFMETPLNYPYDFKIYADDAADNGKIDFEIIKQFLEKKETEEREERYKIVQEWSKRKKMQQNQPEAKQEMDYTMSVQYSYVETEEGFAIKTGEINMGLGGKFEIYENVSYDKVAKKFYFDPFESTHPMHIITKIQNHLAINQQYLIELYTSTTSYMYDTLNKQERKMLLFDSISQWSNELRAFFYKIREKTNTNDETFQRMEYIYDLWVDKFGTRLPKYLNDEVRIIMERSKDPLNILLKVCNYAIKSLMKPGITTEEWLRCRLCLAAFSSIVAFNFGFWETGNNKQEIFHKGIVKDLQNWSEKQLFVVKKFIDKEIGISELNQFKRIETEMEEIDLLQYNNNSQKYPNWFVVGDIKEEDKMNFIFKLLEYMQIVGIGLDQMENIIKHRYLFFRSKANTCNEIFGQDMQRIFKDKFVQASVKSNERVMVKMSEDYNNNPAKILDWVRGIVKCDNVDDLIKQYKKMKNEFETNKNDQYLWKILRVKNGFADQISTVWYSLSVNIEWIPPLVKTQSATMPTISLNHICEIQFTLKTIYKHKNLMHRLYKIQRVEDADNYKYIE